MNEVRNFNLLPDVKVFVVGSDAISQLPVVHPEETWLSELQTEHFEATYVTLEILSLQIALPFIQICCQKF